MLRILVDLNLDTSYKSGKFFETLQKKNIEFILNKRNNIVAFNFGFVLLLAEVNLIPKKQG